MLAKLFKNLIMQLGFHLTGAVHVHDNVPVVRWA